MFALQVKSLKGQKVHKNNEICRMPFILNLNRKLLVIIETSHKSLTNFHLKNMIKKNYNKSDNTLTSNPKGIGLKNISWTFNKIQLHM